MNISRYLEGVTAIDELPITNFDNTKSIAVTLESGIVKATE